MTLQTDLETAIAQINADMQILTQIIQGDDTTTVTTSGGNVKSAAKAIKDIEDEVSTGLLELNVNTSALSQAVADAQAAAALLPKNTWDFSANPTVNDDDTQGYSVGSRGFVPSTNEMYVCISATTGAADWEQTTLTIDDLGSLAVYNLVTFELLSPNLLGDASDILSGALDKLALCADVKNYVDGQIPSVPTPKVVKKAIIDGATRNLNATNGVSSVGGTGYEYVVNFSSSFPNTDYVVTAMAKDSGGDALFVSEAAGTAKTVSQVTLRCWSYSGNQGAPSKIDFYAEEV